MSDLVELKRRVDSAVEQLSTAQGARRGQHDKLVHLLADLEVKFDARHEELNYCHSRITDLEQANNQLADLLNTVIHLIESGTIDDPSDPIFRASQMAADLVNLVAGDPVQVKRDALKDQRSEMKTVEATVVEELPAPAAAPAVQLAPQPTPAPAPAAPIPEAAAPEPAPVVTEAPPQPEPQQATPQPAPPAVEQPAPVADMAQADEVADELEIIDVPEPEDVGPVETIETQEAVVTQAVAPQVEPEMAAEPEVEIAATAIPDEPDQAVPEQEDAPPVLTGVMSGQFDDVDDEELEVENLLEGAADETEMPYDLVAAVRAARADAKAGEATAEVGAMAPGEPGLADALAKVADAVRTSQADESPTANALPDMVAEDEAETAEMDIPGVDAVVDFEIVDIDDDQPISLADQPVEAASAADEAAAGGDADIKALMARIQEAAEKARARSDTSEVGGPTEQQGQADRDETGTG